MAPAADQHADPATPEERLPLRERNKRRTRQAIVDAGIGLFAERGFREVTVTDVATAAGIAPSTFFLYFPTKEDVVFSEHDAFADALVAALRDRAGDASTIETVRDFYGATLPTPAAASELRLLRSRVIDDDAALKWNERVRWAGVLQPVLVESFRRDLDEDAPALRSSLLAALTIGAVIEHRRALREEPELAAPAAQSASLERVVSALQAAYAGLVAGDAGSVV